MSIHALCSCFRSGHFICYWVVWVLFTYLFWPCHMIHGALVLGPGIKPKPPSMAAQSLDHWTAREIYVWVCNIFCILTSLAPIRYMNCKYFLLSCRLPFNSVVFSAVQNLLLFMQFHLSIFSFIACALGVISKKTLPIPVSRSFSFCFSVSFII